MAVTASVSTTLEAFPAAEVATALRDELIEAVKAEALIKGLELPADPGGMAKAAVSIDSLVVVSVLCAVEPIVGFELPESVVRAGGYSSVESALGDVVPRIKDRWLKEKKR